MWRGEVLSWLWHRDFLVVVGGTVLSGCISVSLRGSAQRPPRPSGWPLLGTRGQQVTVRMWRRGARALGGSESCAAAVDGRGKYL